MDRPARTFVLPVPLSRMVAPYTLIRESGPNIGTAIFIPVTNPIESTFATVRHRTKRTKGCLSRKTGLAMAFKLMMSAQGKWRKLDGQNRLPEIIADGRQGFQRHVSRALDCPFVGMLHQDRADEATNGGFVGN